MPSLDDKSKQALRVLLKKPMLSGGELMDLTGFLDLDELERALQPLLAERIVTATDALPQVKSFLSSRFFILPSAVEDAKRLAEEYSEAAKS